MTRAALASAVLVLACASAHAQSAPCVPPCRDAFVCVEGACVSACNPPCPEGTTCTAQATCERPAPAAPYAVAPVAVPVSAPAAVSAPVPAAAPADSRPRFRIALHEVAVAGTTRDAFINATVGARFDYRFTPSLALGAELAYANLEGEDERAHSYLILLQAEALAVLSGTPFAVPVRLGFGHLKQNGLVLRVATGIAWSIARRLDLLLELSPTFWTTPRGVYPSVGPGLELSASF